MMNMKKRIAAIAVLISMLCFCVCSPAAAVSSVKDETDPAVEKYAATMSALGVINGDIRSQKTAVKRGELIERAVVLSGYAETMTAEKVQLPYDDINTDSKYYSAVVTAYKLGYLTDNSAKLNPDDYATVGDAAQLLVNLLGYGRIAKEGSISAEVMANRIGITDGVKAAYGEKLIYSDLIKMMYNAMFTNVMEPERFGDTVKYGQHEPLLTIAFDIEYGSGIVEANPVTSIYSAEGCEWGSVRIDDRQYKSDTGFFDMIGHNVDYYYKESNGIYTMVYMTDNDQTSVLAVDTDDLQGLKETKLTYTDERGKKIEKSIYKAAAFLYNGKLKKFSDIDSDALCGSITLIDSDNDSSADTVSIVSYIHIVVNGTDSAHDKVFGRKDGQEYSFEEKKNEVMAQLYLDDDQINVSDIKIGDVISVAASDVAAKGVRLMRGYACSKSITGSVISADEDKITVEDTTAEFEKGYVEPKLTGYGTFRFAFNGKIVAADMENYVVYGYLYKIKTTGIDGTVAKIFTDKGRWVELDLADRVTYNGERKNARDVMTATELNGTNGFIPQLISYRINDKGKLNLLKTAKEYKRWSDADDKAIDDGEFRLSLKKAASMFRSTLNSFDMEVTLTSNSYVFVVPGNYGDNNIDMDKVKLKTYTSFTADKQYKNLYFYDITRNGTAQAVVVYDELNRMSNDTVICPVSGTGNGTDVNGNPCDIIMVLVDGFELGLAVKDGVIPAGTKIDAGDVIRYVLDDDGEIFNLEIVHKPGDSAYEGKCSGGAYSRVTMISGVTEYVDFENKRIIVRYGEGERAIFDVSALGNVYMYNSERSIVKKVEKTDLAQGQNIFMRLVYGKAQEAVIYEN